MTHTVFLLSPASCSGRRTEVLLSPRATFPLAERLRAGSAPLGEVFSFLSGLYFRGKLAYARTFATPPPGAAPALVISTDRGLLSPDLSVSSADIGAFGAVRIESAGERFTRPLRDAAIRLDESCGQDTRIVLLGSIATAKYTEVLLEVFGDRLLFPAEFVGRGDMSRGGLLLRCVDEGRELAYVSARGAVKRGTRPPRLEPRRR